MTTEKRSTTDQILDLLLDALLERQQARQFDVAEATPMLFRPESSATSLFESSPLSILSEAMIEESRPETVAQETLLSALPEPTSPAAPQLEISGSILAAIEQIEPEITAQEAIKPTLLEKVPSIHLERTLGRWAIVLAVLIVLINIPINRYGTSLARAMPDQKSLIIRDGLVLKGNGPEIYVLENNKKRWISSIDAFEWYGYTWAQVNQVDEKFLETFPDGRPIHLLLKCPTSPHVYALEKKEKRWIKDIPTFEVQGFVWSDIKTIDCASLRRLPDGPPIPPDAGLPPQP